MEVVGRLLEACKPTPGANYHHMHDRRFGRFAAKAALVGLAVGEKKKKTIPVSFFKPARVAVIQYVVVQWIIRTHHHRVSPFPLS